MGLDRPGEAMPYLERSMTLRPDDLTARADNLWYLTIYPNPSPRRALELAQELVAAEPDRAECWSRLGAGRVCAGDFSGGRRLSSTSCEWQTAETRMTGSSWP